MSECEVSAYSQPMRRGQPGTLRDIDKYIWAFLDLAMELIKLSAKRLIFTTHQLVLYIMLAFLSNVFSNFRHILWAH